MAILIGPDVDAARAWAIDLARSMPPFGDDRSLISGDAGFALLCRALGDDAPASAETIIERGLAAMVDGTLRRPHFYDGFSGVIWAADRIGAGIDSSDIDDVLTLLLDRGWRGHYDLGTGLTGLGVYAIASPKRAAMAGRIIALLEDLAMVTDRGMAWFTPPAMLHPSVRAERPDGMIDTGLPHGVCGVIAFLARAALNGVERDRTRRMLVSAVSWLLAQRLPRGGSSHFEQPRLAWCYGELAVASTLLAAGAACEEASWIDVAIDVARDAARRPARSSGVVDAPLCHGAAGVAHLFSRFHDATGDVLFADAARRWFATLMEMRGRDDYLTLRAAEDGSTTRERVAGLLEGDCGVALALLSAAGATLDWDALLLIDPPTRRTS